MAKLSTTATINSHMDCNEDSVKHNTSSDCKTAINNELKLISAEINIITKWIERKFGTPIINKSSDLFSESIYKSEEIESLSEYLTLPNDLGITDNKSLHSHNKKVRPRKVNRKTAINDGEQKCPPGIATAKSRKCRSKTAVINEANDLEGENVFIKRETRNKKSIHKTSTTGDLGTKDDLNNHSQQPKSPGKPNKRGRVKSADWRKYACSGPKQCDECGKVVMGTSSLKQHMRMHADERPFECSECKQKFRYGKNLKIHMIALHNGERHLQCSFCGKKFYAPKDLKIHERTHTGHKPYACHICPKKFNIKEHLTMHIRVHTGERPYKCPICEKSFSQANSLRIHKKIHTKSVEDKPRKKRQSTKAKGDIELLAIDSQTVIIPKCPTIESNVNNDVIPHMHPTSVSTFQLMVPTMQTVTAAIVSVSTVTSPFPCVNLSQSQTGNENPLGMTNYVPLMGSLEGSSRNEPIKSPLGDSSKAPVASDSELISPNSAPPLGNPTSENSFETEKKKGPNYVYLN